MTACDTLQRVEVGSKEGKAFLRRVIRDNADCSIGERWSAHASPENDWTVRLMRTVRGKVGDPDVDVTVDTDVRIITSGCLEGGMNKSFSDCQPVMMASVHRVCMGDAQVFAKLALDGSRFMLSASSGSTSSSEYGLSFYSIQATLPGMPYCPVTIGHETVAKDGRTIISGDVLVR